jgi:acyl-CoA thioesterase
VVKPAGHGRYSCTLDHSWDLAVPQGGVVASFALRAAACEVQDSNHQLRTCTTVFAGQVVAGELEVEITVLRSGRTATQVMASIHNRGAKSGAITLAVFGSKRRGPSFVDVAPPTVALPEECRSYRDPLPPEVEAFEQRPFWTGVEGRAALGHAPRESYEPCGSDVATWLRFDDPPVQADGSIDPLGVLTLTDRMPGCVGERIGHDDESWFAPSADLTVHFFEPAMTSWLLAHDRARWADDGWASAESTLWDEQGTPSHMPRR